MKKYIYFKLGLFIILLICKNNAFSQIEDLNVLDNFRGVINNIFSDIDTSKLSTGIMIERSLALSDITKFDISNSDSSFCNVWDWLNLHNQLYLAHVGPVENKMKKSLIENYPLHGGQNDPIPLGIIFYDYNKINGQAINNGYIVVDTINKKIRDVSGPNIIPFDTVTCFAATFLTDREVTTGLHPFSFNPNFLISNKITSFDSLYIDFNDGLGFTQINSDEFTVSYLSPGKKNLKIRAFFNGEGYEAYSSFNVIDDYSVRNQISPDSGPYDYIEAEITARYGIWYGCNNNNQEIRKPYLIVSGFDPMENNRILIPDPKDNGKDIDKKISLYNVSNKNGFLDQLRDDGFDIIIYRSTNSTKSVISNAMNLVKFIMKINEEKTTNNELIIAGASMGGLVVRYALTYMEYNNIEHHTKLFISVDSPQEGATVPLGVQSLVVCLNSDFAGILPFLVSLLKDAKNNMLDAVAAKEMLLYHYTGLQGSDADPARGRIAYLNSLNSIGSFPQKCRSVALSMGSGTGTGQGFTAGQSVLKKHSGSIAGGLINLLLATMIIWEFEVWAVPDNTHKKIYEENISMVNYFFGIPFPVYHVSRDIYVNNTVPIDNAPGSKQGLHNLKIIEDDTMRELLKILGSVTVESNYDCFIPSHSALGISLNDPHTDIKNYLNNHSHVYKMSNNMYMSKNNNSPSYFDFMYIENTNDFHIYHPTTKEGVFSNDMLSAMTELSAPYDLYLDRVTIYHGKAVDYDARHNITAGYGVDEIPVENGDVMVENGGSLNLYAGESVTLKPGFHAQAGSNMKISITNGWYCPLGTFSTSAKSLVMVSEYKGEEKKDEQIENKMQEIPLFEIIKKYDNPVIFFPNPVQQQLNISSNENENHFYMYNMHGILIDDAPFYRTFSINMSPYSSGIYIVKVIQKNGTVVSQKIVKQ